MDSILNLLFEEWNNLGPIPNGNHFGCRFPYCKEYIETNNIRLEDIELYENIFFPIDLNTDFYSIFREDFFSEQILKLIFDRKIKILLLREHEGGGNHFDFFQKLYQLIKTHNLEPTLFYLNFANKNLFSYYKDSIGDVGMNLNISDWLLEHTSLVVHKALESNKINDLGYRFELPNFEPEIERKFKFLCLNRVPKAHRIAFLARLYKNKSIYNTDWSLLFSPYEFTTLFGEESDENGKNIFSIEHFSAYFSRNELQDHFSELKYFFYTKKKSNYEPYSKNLFNFFGDTKSTHFKETYKNSFVSLITETSFENNEEHISEKSLKPFVNLHLGVFLSPYKHLDRIRSFGFQTFNSLWDEEYDTIYEPMKRMAMVSELVSKLDTINLSEQYKKAEEIIKHNQSHFLNFWKRESCKKYFKKLANGI